MTPEQWEQVGGLYRAVLDLQPDERASFLNEACGDDKLLREEVESLLAAEDGAGDFLDAGAMKDAAKMLVGESSLMLVGKNLGHYQLLSLLGSGGMGEVYLAEDTRLKRKVALKLLPAELTANRDRLRRFEHEARAASALNHPNIITIHEIGQVDGLNFIVTELIEGQTLRQLIATARMKLPLVLDVAMQVASALTAAHAAGIIHRDLKPENVMLRPDGLIKVLDFGLAKLTESRTSNVDSEAQTVGRVDTEMGTVMGTAQYMSPEQARGLKVDCADSQRAPTTLDGSVRYPAELQHIVSKALRKDKEERYQTVKSLLTDLKTLKQELEFAAKLERSGAAESKDKRAADNEQAATASAARVNAETQTASARPTSSAEYLVTRIKQHRSSLAAGLVLLLVAAVGFSYWLYNGHASKPAQIESIAVLPFVNESGSGDVEYLSDGMTESLINSLSQLPHLSVKARSSVFRYKGKEVEPQRVAAEASSTIEN